MNFGTAVASGNFVNSPTEQSVTFPAQTAMYIKFVALSEVNGNPWTSAAEIKIFGTGPIINASCTMSTAAWNNTSLSSQTSTFSATYDDTPNAVNMDGLTGLSLNAASGYTSLAVITRFNPAGTIDARNGSVFAAINSVPYTAGVNYHFRLVINPAAHTYSAYVTPNGGSEIQIRVFINGLVADGIEDRRGIDRDDGTGPEDFNLGRRGPGIAVDFA